jgi:hypothetical protein
MKSKQIIKTFEGHLVTQGALTGEIRNKYYLVQNEEELYYEMETGSEVLFSFSVDDLDKILFKDDKKSKHITWYLHKKIGYITANIDGKYIYLHQHIMNFKGNGKGKESVDHINRNKLDNRRENLRITTQSVQNENCGKRRRKNNAKPLPTELVEWLKTNRNTSNLPKFIVYYSEFKNEKMIKEFFKIEKHKELEKPWASPKGMLNISLVEKYILTEEMLKKISGDNIEFL